MLRRPCLNQLPIRSQRLIMTSGLANRVYGYEDFFANSGVATYWRPRSGITLMLIVDDPKGAVYLQA